MEEKRIDITSWSLEELEDFLVDKEIVRIERNSNRVVLVYKDSDMEAKSISQLLANFKLAV